MDRPNTFLIRRSNEGGMDSLTENLEERISAIGSQSWLSSKQGPSTLFAGQELLVEDRLSSFGSPPRVTIEGVASVAAPTRVTMQETGMGLSKSEIYEIVSSGVRDTISRMGLLDKQDDRLSQISRSIAQLNYPDRNGELMEALTKIKVDVEPPDLSRIEQAILLIEERHRSVLETMTKIKVNVDAPDLSQIEQAMFLIEDRHRSVLDAMTKIKVNVEAPDLSRIEEAVLLIQDRHRDVLDAMSKIQVNVEAPDFSRIEQAVLLIEDRHGSVLDAMTNIKVNVEAPDLSRIEQAIMLIEDRHRDVLNAMSKIKVNVEAPDLSRIEQAIVLIEDRHRDVLNAMSKIKVNVEAPDLSRIEQAIVLLEDRHRDMLDAMTRIKVNVEAPDLSRIEQAIALSEDRHNAVLDAMTRIKVNVEPPDFSRMEHAVVLMEDRNRDVLDAMAKIKVQVEAPDLSKIEQSMSLMHDRHSDVLDTITKLKVNVEPPDMFKVEEAILLMEARHRDLLDAVTNIKVNVEPPDLTRIEDAVSKITVNVKPPELSGIERAVSQLALQQRQSETKIQEMMTQLTLDVKSSGRDVPSRASIVMESSDQSSIRQTILGLKNDIKNDVQQMKLELQADIQKNVDDLRKDLRDDLGVLQQDVLGNRQQLQGLVEIKNGSGNSPEMPLAMRQLFVELLNAVRKIELDLAPVAAEVRTDLSKTMKLDQISESVRRAEKLLDSENIGRVVGERIRGANLATHTEIAEVLKLIPLTSPGQQVTLSEVLASVNSVRLAVMEIGTVDTSLIAKEVCKAAPDLSAAVQAIGTMQTEIRQWREASSTIQMQPRIVQYGMPRAATPVIQTEVFSPTGNGVKYLSQGLPRSASGQLLQATQEISCGTQKQFSWATTPSVRSFAQPYTNGTSRVPEGSLNVGRFESPSWWTLRGVVPAFQKAAEDGSVQVGFSEEQQVQFGIEEDGTVLHHAKFDAAVAALGQPKVDAALTAAAIS